VTALSCVTSLAGNVPSLTDAELGQGLFSKMHMLIEKTLLAVDVATLEVRVDPKTEVAFESIAKGKPYTQALESELARTMFGAKFAVFELTFLRGISLSQYVDGVRESLNDAHEAGLIDDALRKRVSAGLPRWFEAVQKRGFHEGDRVVYAITPTQLRTTVITQGGQVSVDRTDIGADKRMILLGSYFAPGTSYRKALLSSLGK
jgi:hypothetical protein